MLRLENQSALITGAASDKGIGRAIATAFAIEGASVACFDSDETGCASTVDSILSSGGNAIAIHGDVSSSNAASRAVEATLEAFGKIDILVNNAAIARFRPILEVSEAEWDLHMAVNLKGYFLFSKAAAKAMIKQETKGSIINISSISATLAGEHKVHYCVSKAGVLSLTKGMALELDPYGIRVNAISPGAVETNIVKDTYIQEILDRSRQSSQTRIGTANDIAPAAVFLASNEASFITGADMVADGGLTLGQRLPK